MIKRLFVLLEILLIFTVAFADMSIHEAQLNANRALIKAGFPEVLVIVRKEADGVNFYFNLDGFREVERIVKAIHGSIVVVATITKSTSWYSNKAYFTTKNFQRKAAWIYTKDCRYIYSLAYKVKKETLEKLIEQKFHIIAELY